MLKGSDLDDILGRGFGDAGFNDPVPDIGALLAEAPSQPKASAKPAAKPAAKAVAATPAAALAEPKLKPHSRPVLGASPPPPEGASPEEAELEQLLDEAAREKGFECKEDYDRYLAEQSGSGLDAIAEDEESQQPPLAPGIKKAPAYMPPGAYPGDRTKLGKEYEKAHGQADEEAARERPFDPEKEGVTTTFVRQSDAAGAARPAEGHTVEWRLLDGAPERAELGAADVPWGLEAAALRMKVGDVVDVVARGEHAFADDEEPASIEGVEKRWRVELLGVEGRALDKFQLTADERVERADELRLRGNGMFKRGRVLRAMDYYERGSRLMDILEAEEMPGMGGSGASGGVVSDSARAAAERNRKIWQCQKPLLLNWALILMKRGCWRRAERKCTEVLMDIDKENVKALFRRGQCNVHLRDHEQARMDLRRAGELDTTIAREVEREMKKVDELRRAEERQDAPVAKKVVGEMLREADPRSAAPPPVDGRPAEFGGNFMRTLDRHRDATDRDDVDEETYCQQRQSIYNHFFRVGGGAGAVPAGGEEDC